MCQLKNLFAFLIFIFLLKASFDEERELAISKLQGLIKDAETEQLKFLVEIAQAAHGYVKKRG